jgi:hypothetical protein
MRELAVLLEKLSNYKKKQGRPSQRSAIQDFARGMCSSTMCSSTGMCSSSTRDDLKVQR